MLIINFVKPRILNIYLNRSLIKVKKFSISLNEHFINPKYTIGNTLTNSINKNAVCSVNNNINKLSLSYGNNNIHLYNIASYSTGSSKHSSDVNTLEVDLSTDEFSKYEKWRVVANTFYLPNINKDIENLKSKSQTITDLINTQNTNILRMCDNYKKVFRLH